MLENASNIKKEGFISLATFKPKETIDLVVKSRNIVDEQEKKTEILKKLHNQEELIERDDIPEYWRVAQSIPYSFYYLFKDDENNQIKLMIEDWEIMMLYLHGLNGKNGKEAEKETIKNGQTKIFSRI